MSTTFIILVILIGILPAAIAHGKGGNFLLWWIFGSALFYYRATLCNSKESLIPIDNFGGFSFRQK